MLLSFLLSTGFEKEVSVMTYTIQKCKSAFFLERAGRFPPLLQGQGRVAVLIQVEAQVMLGLET